MEDKHERLRDWYLAHLRRKAIEKRSVTSMTPSSLVRADREKFEQMIGAANRQTAQAEPARPITFVDEHAPRAQQIQSLCIAAGVECLVIAIIDSARALSTISVEAIVVGETFFFLVLLVTLVFIFLRARETSQVRSINVHLKPELTSEMGLDQTNDLHVIAQSLVDALEKSLQKERAIADYSPHFICSLDEEYRFLAAGPSSLALTGFLAEELSGAPVSQVLHPEDLRAFSRSLQQSIVSEVEVSTHSRIITKGSEILEMVWTFEWSDAEQAFYCVGQDVTGQRELERIRKEIDLITHDLKSPLAAVKTALGLMVMGTYGPMPPPAQEQLEKSLQTINRLLNQVQQKLEKERQQEHSGSWRK